MNSITVKAYAKINIGLDVIRKREDNYHEVSMIMQSVGLYDTITIKRIKPKASKNIFIQTNLPYLPVDNRNIVYKAVELFQEHLKISGSVHVTIHKRIPVAAGLAGGSSDAAATLKGLNMLYDAGLSVEELKKLGVRLGADVPYCLMLGTVLSEGIGEILTPLPPLCDCHILLVKPDISVSTKYVYDNLSLDKNVKHPDIPSLIKAIEGGKLTELTSLMDNILQSVTEREYPIITQIKTKLLETGSLVSLMSGSGPTVFGIYDTAETAQKAYMFFKTSNYGKQVFLTKPYWPE